MNFEYSEPLLGLSLAPDKPDVIYAAGISGAVALGILYLTNRAAAKRQSLEIQAKADEKNSERAYLLKKELYLGFIDSLINAEDHLRAHISHDPLDLENRTVQRLLTHQIAKLLLVASPEVYKAVREYALAAGSAEVELKMARSETEGEIRKLLPMKEGRKALGSESLDLQQKLTHVNPESPTPAEQEALRRLEAVESSRHEHIRLDLAVKMRTLKG
jgi:hypothetical protein